MVAWIHPTWSRLWRRVRRTLYHSWPFVVAGAILLFLTLIVIGIVIMFPPQAKAGKQNDRSGDIRTKLLNRYYHGYPQSTNGNGMPMADTGGGQWVSFLKTPRGWVACNWDTSGNTAPSPVVCFPETYKAD